MMLQFWIPILINIAVYVVTFAVGWGKLTAKIAEIENKYTDLKDEIESIKSSRVHKEKCVSDMGTVNSKLDELRELGIDRRLIRIETLLETILEKLN